MEKDERPMSLWALWWPERAATWLGCEELGAELGVPGDVPPEIWLLEFAPQ